MAHYGIDLRGALWGPAPIGVRRLLSLVSGLPTRSATARAVDSDGQDWSDAEELLATLIEITDMTNRLIFQANAKRGARVWRPIMIPRPGADKRKPKPATAAELRAFVSGSGMGKARVDMTREEQ